jgi:hypothetical protein
MIVCPTFFSPKRFSRSAAVRGLESLELAIDDCLTTARTMDKEGLADVIGLLRQARNTVVWKMGE